jgi:hypothetical protein
MTRIPRLFTPPTDEQTADYTYDMLMALKELASQRGQETLAVLLAAAAAEARALAHPAAEAAKRA